MKAELSLTSQTPLRAVLEQAAEALTAAGIDSARLDAELLMAAALDSDRIKVFASAVELSTGTLLRYQGLIARRAAREPLAYIVGRKEFFSLELEVNPAVLIPRPETEDVVAAALEAAARRRDCSILDLGTGSGAVALAIAAGSSRTRIVATDVSEQALEVARRNAVRLGLDDRIEFRRSDCWAALAISGEGFRPEIGGFDLVVSNPPYIENRELDRLQPEIARFEPRVALAGGIDGLDFYRRICFDLRSYLKPGGELIVEVGAGQAESVAALCRAGGCAETAVINDLAGCRAEGRGGCFFEDFLVAPLD